MQQPLQERRPYLGGLARNPLLESTDASQETGTSVLYLLDFMQKVEVFQNLSEDELLQLAEAFTSQHAEDGEKLVQEGDEGSELFFIESGTVSVRTEERELTRLSQGQYFGETALVEKAPRNASVYAVGDVRLRVLTRDHFEMFDLHRKLHLELKHANMTNGLQELLGDLVTLRTFLKAVALLGGYLLLAILLFSSLEGWSWVDCVYFAVITLMTVGYGDFAPKHWGSRLLLVFFVLISLVIVATSIGEFLEGLVTLEIRNERARKALQLKQARVGVFDKLGQKKAWRRKALGCLAALVTLLGVSSGIARIAVQNCATWADALYFSVVTLSTIGYGDLTPIAEPGSRVVIGFLALLGVPVFGIVLAKIVEIAYGRAKSNSMPCVVGGLTNEKFDELVDFTDKLWRGGGYNSHPQQSLREQITPFEFLCFILTQNETVSLDEIKLIMANFSELDLTKTGLLEQQDVDEWLKRGSCNPAGFSASSSPRKGRKLSVMTAMRSTASSSSGGAKVGFVNVCVQDLQGRGERKVLLEVLRSRSHQEGTGSPGAKSGSFGRLSGRRSWHQILQPLWRALACLRDAARYVGLVSALVSAVASAVVVRAAVGEAPVQQPSSCGVARNSTTSCGRGCRRRCGRTSAAGLGCPSSPAPAARTDGATSSGLAPASSRTAGRHRLTSSTSLRRGKAFIYVLEILAQVLALVTLARRLPQRWLAFIDNVAGQWAFTKGYGKDPAGNGLRLSGLPDFRRAVQSRSGMQKMSPEPYSPALAKATDPARCVPWRLAGTHLVDQHTGELQMDLTDTLEECCDGCDALAECQAWIFERMAKRCRWIQFDDPVCREDPGDLGLAPRHGSGDRSSDTAVEDGKAMYTYAETLKFPDGVAAEKLDEAELETSGPSMKKAVESILAAKDSVPVFKELLSDIKAMQKPSQKLDLDEVAEKVQAASDKLAASKIHLYLCSVQQKVTEAKDPDLEKSSAHFKWILVIDREAAPDFKVMHAYMPVISPKGTEKEKTCAVM
ncbi:Pka-R2 [Symbiodinium microadriaticum]|nr:Pka-R2 [Symbiodinium microadriaticum]